MGMLEQLFETNPYDGFPADLLELDHAGFNLAAIALDLVHEVRPTRIIEVGTWKGNSAFFMTDRLLAMDIQFEMICVDTWLGLKEMWMPEIVKVIPECRGLKPRYGYPTVYYQFLANVIKKGLQDKIVPFPTTSAIAYEILAGLNYTAQFIFIDGSHIKADVAQDVNNYWELVEPGGILCGDDYSSTPAVIAAVDELVKRTGCPLGFTNADCSWWIRKP